MKALEKEVVVDSVESSAQVQEDQERAVATINHGEKII
jgi:hypothetical protein